MKKRCLLIFISFYVCFNANSRNISDENIIAFAKLTGYVKYFYPHQNKKKIDWTSFTFNGINQIINIKDDKIFINKLRQLFSKISPSLIIVQADSIKNTIITKRKWSKIRYVKYKGAALDKKGLPFITRLMMISNKYSLITSKYSDSPHFNNKRLNENYLTLKLNKKISCFFPVFVENSKKESIKYPRLKELKDKTNKKAYRISEIINIWNLFLNFYPYFNEVKCNWDSILIHTINKITDSSLTEKEYFFLLQEMIASLDDGHAFISYNKGIGVYFTSQFPINFELINNQLIVASDYFPLKKGDIIKKINNISILELISKERKITSASTNKSRDNKLLSKLNSYFTNNSKITYIRKNIKKISTLNIKKIKNKNKKNTNIVFYNSVTYINLYQLKYKEFRKKKDDILKSSGIIFDLRKYPSSKFTSKILPLFIDTTLELGNLFKPVFLYPNQIDVTLDSVYRWKIVPTKLYYNIPLVFLVGPGTMSYGETCAEIIDYYNLGVIIGENTAGTNGDMNFAAINDKVIGWTGNKFLKRSGNYFHTVGIAPNIKVTPTIKSIQEGRDNVLEVALKYLKNDKKIKSNTKTNK